MALRLRWPTRSNLEHGLLRLAFQHLATIQGRRKAGKVLFNAVQDGQQVGVEPVDFVLSLPLPFDKPAIQQARQIVRHAALLDTEFVHDLPNIVGLASQQLHDGESRLVRERPEELTIESEIQSNLPLV